MKPLHLSLCTECGTLGVDDVRKALGDLNSDVAVTASPCLGSCDQPSVLALQTRGHAGYIFAGVTQNDAADIAATCALVLQSDQGWIEDARPCGRLRHLLVARMPAKT